MTLSLPPGCNNHGNRSGCEAWALKLLPDSRQISRLIFLCSGWFASGNAGRLRRFLDGGRLTGGRTRTDVAIGYHDCVCHIRTTIIPVALSWMIF